MTANPKLSKISPNFLFNVLSVVGCCEAILKQKLCDLKYVGIAWGNLDRASPLRQSLSEKLGYSDFLE